MNEQLVQSLIAVAIIILVSFPVHEFSHAYAAYQMGDSTARWQGRLTLNPIVHFDPLGGALLAISALVGGVFIGWAKPTPVNPYNLRFGRRGDALVALAGPISNLVIAAAVAIPIRLITANADMYATVLSNDVALFILDTASFFVVINVFLLIFNLLPIPPLDGWHVLLGAGRRTDGLQPAPVRAIRLHPAAADHPCRAGFHRLDWIRLGALPVGAVTSGWWSAKGRRFWRYFSGRVSAAERRQLAEWLTPAQLGLFDAMHRADQRHGLDVVRALRVEGRSEQELLLAGLLHDCGKGRALHVWHRVGWSLVEHYGLPMERVALRLPSFAPAFETIRQHAERSAEMAQAAGASQATVDLIRHQAEPIDADGGRALLMADEAN